MRARVRTEEGFGRPAEACAARATGEPLPAPRGAGRADQLPAIVSTGLNAPCSTL